MKSVLLSVVSSVHSCFVFKVSLHTFLQERCDGSVCKDQSNQSQGSSIEQLEETYYKYSTYFMGMKSVENVKKIGKNTDLKKKNFRQLLDQR